MIFQKHLTGADNSLQRANKLGLWLTNAFLIGTLLVLGILPVLAYEWMQVPFMGAFVEPTLVFNDVIPQGNISSLGITTGIDSPYQLISINGQNVKSARDVTNILSKFLPGDQVEVLYGTQDDIIRTDIRLQNFPLNDLFSFFVIPYSIGWAYLLIGVWVFRLRWHSAAGRIFLVFCASVSISIGSLFDLYTTHVFPWLWIISLAIAAASLLTLGLIFPKEVSWSKKYPVLRWIGYVSAVVLILFGEWSLSKAPHTPSAYVNAWQREYFFASLSILFFLGMAFYWHLRASTVIVRDQARVILLGGVLAFSPIAYYVVRVVAYEPLAFNVATFCLPLIFFPLAIGYAILHHRLLNIDRLIIQSIAYVILVFIVVASYVFLSTIAYSFSGVVISNGNNIFIIGSVITIVLIFVFNPLRVWIQGNVEVLFARQKRNLTERVWEFDHFLRDAVDFHQLVSALRHVLEQTVQPTQAYLFARDNVNDCFRFYPIIIGQRESLVGRFECSTDNALVRFLEAQEKGTVFITDKENMPRDLRAEWDKFASLNATVFFPFSSQNGLIGWLALGSSLTGEAYSRDDLIFLESIGHHAATAIERAWLFLAERERQNVVEALKDAAAALTSTLDFELVLDRILANVKKVVYHEAINIMLIEGDVVRVVRRQGEEKYTGEAAKVDRKMPVNQTPSLTNMLKKRQAEIIYDTREHPDWVDHPENHWVRSYLGVPIRNKGQVIGFLNLNSNTPNFFTETHAENLLAFADQAGAAIENSRLFNGLQQANAELLAAYDTTLEGWVHALDLRDKETEGHSQRVTRLTIQLAKALGLKDDELLHIKRGALLHDIGKIGVSDTILQKAGDLSKEERHIMCQHPIYSYEMLSSIEFLRPAIDIPYGHHERWDGKGYPRGLAGEDIPLAARIFAIVDVWDALVTDRPYRKAWLPRKVADYLKRQAGTHFDPNLLEPFFTLPEIQQALQNGSDDIQAY